MDKLFATLRDKDNLEDNLKGLPKLNLQFHTEGGGAGAGGAGEGGEGDGAKKDSDKDPDKTYTQEEMDKLLQSETDKRVTKALETARKKWEGELEKTVDTKIKEAEKLLKMTEEEKQQHLISEKEKELMQKENEIAIKELKLTAIDILNEKKLPISFVDMLLPIDLSAETTKTNIEIFEKVFREEVQKAVDERIKSTAPGAGNGTSTDGKNDITSLAAARNKEYKPELNPWG